MKSIDSGQLLSFARNRRTIRKYSDRLLSETLLSSLLEAAAHAPNTGNMQLYSVVVTRDEEGKKRLSPAHFGQPSVTGAQAVLTFCADLRRFSRWCGLSNATPGYDNFQALTWGIVDATIVAQQFVTLAEAEGLGTCYLGTTTYNAPEIASILRLPELVVPVVTVTVGWPEGESKVSDRLPLGAWVFDEVYEESSDEALKSFYAEKESLEENKKYVAENGKQTLAQVFTDIRYKKADNELFSTKFKEFLKQQGFGRLDNSAQQP